MLDLLIASSKNKAQIDDAGIQEEVDTFMFEVYIYLFYKFSKDTVIIIRGLILN